MDLRFLAESWVALISGLLLTIQLASLSILIGAILAAGLAAMRLSGNRWLALPARAYVFAVRGTPLLVQLFLVYYGLGQFREALETVHLWTFFRQPYWCALLALSLSTAAYGSEIIRGAVLSVPHGQIDAARACGMKRSTMFRRIVFPLALRQALPAYSNEIILMVKATSLASTITLVEVTFIAHKLISESYRAIEIFIAAGSIYLLLNVLIAGGVALAERRLAVELRPRYTSIATVKEMR
jgi:octopine/nopaline transport system permease protein